MKRKNIIEFLSSYHERDKGAEKKLRQFLTDFKLADIATAEKKCGLWKDTNRES